uniref:Putative portal protein n=1 Tax=viral metagenome TaxID=1070528 RepID=A0A6M3KVV8_9ZZZZ
MLETLRARLALAVLPRQKADNRNGPSPFQIISTQPANIPVYSDMTVRKSTREGYKLSVYVYRAVRTIIQAASAVPWVVLDDKGEQIEDHPLTEVLKNPNPVFSGQDMIEFLIGHLELVGNALWQPIIVGNKVKEIWPVMPDLVQPIPSDVPGEWLKGWQVTEANGRLQIVEPNRFIHFMQIDPGNPYWGMGPLLAAARTIDTDNEAQDTQKISMQNRATPDGVFTHEDILTLEQFEEARRQIREQYLAKNRRREPWVLGAGTKWNQMSLTPVEMDFIASRLANLRGIAAAFGIDPWWLGDKSASTYNNVEEARKALYEVVVLPMLDDIKATLNLRIAPMYGNIVIAYDTSKVAALRADYSKKVEQAKSLWSMGVPFDKINSRLEMGFEEFPGWDVGYLPFTLAPAGTSGPIAPAVEGAAAGEPIESKTLTPRDWEEAYSDDPPHWAVDLTPSLFAQEFAQEMADRKLKSVLEIGCGNGRDSIFFARAGFKVTAIDVAPSAIKLAEENTKEAEVTIDFQVANAEKLPFKDGEFDAMFSLSVLHATKLSKSLPEVNRVLADNGLAFVYIYGDTEFANGQREEVITADKYLELVKALNFIVLDFYSEQETQFDEFGEKHLILVSLLQKAGEPK